MCGIVGFWNRDSRPADARRLDGMMRRLAHRGPDDRGAWCEGALALGHVRLSVLDLTPSGHQPALTADGQGVLCHSGEIFNYRELRARLEAEGVRFTGSSDSEVLLHALHLWGPARAIPQLNGMFAFAYFDRRDRTLWLARDRAGIMPLYLARTGELLAFASEMKAFFADDRIACRPDMLSLATQVFYGRLDGAWTPFENVECVLPGTFLRVDEGGVSSTCYFDLLRDLDVARIAGAGSDGMERSAAELEGRLAASVELHLQSDAPLAAMCSGGVDSSLLTALARARRDGLAAYVADVAGAAVSEKERAERVCRHLRVELRPVPVSAREFLRLWPSAVFHNDQPNFYPSDIPYLAVARAAHREGCKVLLAGEGADELFGGYAWQAAVHRMWRLRRLHAALLPDLRPLRAMGRIARHLAPLDLAALARHPFRRLSGASTPSRDARESCVFDGAKRMERESALFQRLEGVTPLEERAFLARSFDDFYTHLRTSLESHNKMGMASSVEVRVPFVENELIGFGLHLPCGLKYRGGEGKRVLKSVARRWLPADAVRAPKVGFEVPVSLWRPGAPLLRDGWVRDAFRWGEAEFGRIQRAVEARADLLFHLVSMELWARIYLEGESPETLGEELAGAGSATPRERRSMSAASASRSSAGPVTEAE